MTDSILNFVNSYNSKLALLIDGEWGYGKSYYIKNHLTPQIEKVTGFQVNYISLFGLSDPADIYLQIFSSRLANKIPGAALKTLLKLGASTLEKLFGVSPNVPYQDLIKFEKCVFIFDDLERISENV